MFEAEGQLTRSWETVRLEHEQAVATLTLARPEKRNALSPRMAAEVADALDLLGNARALVLAGDGPAFCGGWDLAAVGEADDAWVGLNERIAALPLPTVAAIQGACVGGGLALALSCDLRVASAEVRLGFPEVARGLLAAQGCTWRLPRVVGPSVAKRMMLLGDLVDAGQALAWGLVDDIAPTGEHLAAAAAIARRLAAGPPVAQRWIKRLLDGGLDCTLEQALANEALAMMELVMSDDAREGIKAFFERRRPVFRGS